VRCEEAPCQIGQRVGQEEYKQREEDVVAVVLVPYQ
jgi:hypothetical protein